MSGGCPFYNFPCSKQKMMQSELNGDIVEVCQECPYNLKPNKDCNSTCPSCGLTFDEILRGSLFGCGQCYSFFETMTKVIVESKQSSHVHTGKTPNCLENMNLPVLKKCLAKAIKEENYELAAKCKKIINEKNKS